MKMSWSPPGSVRSSRQSTYAIESASIGDPVAPTTSDNSEKSLGPGVANALEIVSCSTPNTLMAKHWPSRMYFWIAFLRSTDINTKGGSSESEMIAFAVMPQTSSPTRVVTRVTPVAKQPIILRCRIESNFIGFGDLKDRLCDLRLTVQRLGNDGTTSFANHSIDCRHLGLSSMS